MIKIFKLTKISLFLVSIFLLLFFTNEHVFAANNEELIKQYTGYSAEGAQELIRCGVSPELAKEYRGNNWWTICRLHETGISPKQVRAYPKRFDMAEIAEIARAGISAKEAKKFPGGIRSWTIARLAEKGISAKETTSELRNYYKIDKKQRNKPRRFSNDNAAFLLAFGIDFKVALSYPKYSDMYDIRQFVGDNVSPEIVEEYSAAKNKNGEPRFGADIISLVKAKIPLSEAVKYPEGVYGGAYDISQFIAHGISPETVASYSNYDFPDDLDGAFYWDYIIRLEEAKKK